MARMNAYARSQRRGGRAEKDPFKAGFRAIAKLAEVTGGGKNPAVQAAGRELRKGIRQVLSVAATPGQRLRPGMPPRRRTGKLRRSIRLEVVSGMLRVGPSRFTGNILEHGAIIPTRKSNRTKKGKDRPARRGYVIPPHPFMRPGLERARPKMGGAVVGALRDRTRKAFGGGLYG